MEINEKDLVKLLDGEIYKAHVIWRKAHYDGDPTDDAAFLEWGTFENVTLEWIGGQDFFILGSDSDEMVAGFTISVDEILDIVL